MKKKMLGVLLAASLLLTGATASAQVTDGAYETTAQGNNGAVVVKTTFEDGKIAGVELVEQNETVGLGDVAAEKIIDRIVSTNSVAVDTISGATNTSNAVLTAVRAAIAAAGGSEEDFSEAAVSSVELEDQTTEVLVIGGGAAGLTAANAAIRNGKQVLLIEKNGSTGGATAVSGGGFMGGASKLQAELGVTDDSPDLIYEDLLRGGEDNDETMLRLYAENGGATVDWMYYDLELPINQTLSQTVEHSVARGFSMEGGAPAITAELQKSFESVGGTVLLETRATSLLMEDGKVIGAAVSTPDGTYNIYAESVILATGGFGANRDLLPDSVANVLFYGISTATGDGLLMAEEVGAMTWYMDHVKVYPHGVETSEGIAAVGTGGAMNATAKAGAIYVNSEGQRVVNENTTFTEIRDVTLAQEDEVIYLVMDAEAFDIWKTATVTYHFMSEEQIDAAVSANGGIPLFANGSTLEEAAAAAGIDSESLVQTVADWNAAVEKGVDEAFGNPYLFAIDEGPFYIVKMNTRFASTLGGLKINTDMQVLDTNEQPIVGLYAAGEIVGGAHGKDSMPTCNVGWALTTGRLAGEAVSAEAE